VYHKGGLWNLMEDGEMDRWDIIILLAAGYLAVMTLVRLMARRRDQVVEHVREKIAENRGAKHPAKEPAKKDDKEKEAA